MRKNTLRRMLVGAAAFFTSLSGAALAAQPQSATPLVHGVVSDAVRLPLLRDVPGVLSTSTDEGQLNDAVVLPHIRLALMRPPDRQAALDTLTREQHVKGSPVFHQWLQPAALRSYGPAQADITQVARWLASHNLRVNSVSRSGMSIDFSGRAGDVASAFHTQLHNVLHAGEAHISNISAPSIPTALAPVVAGVSLSNFFPKPALRPATPGYTKTISGTTFYAVTPSDFATIYNVTPLLTGANLYGVPITGAGVTVAVVEQTQINPADWATFRKTFGLAGYAGSLTQVNPGGCTSPGFTGDEIEAAIDAEWASAVAPAANILEASCAGSGVFGFGVLNSLENLVEGGTPATIFSISYGGPEVGFGFAFMQTWNNLLEEGAAEGKAIFVSAGDSGVSADRGEIDSDGLFVNGLSDTAYNVSVGGTDFYDTALGQNATYWKPGNGVSGGSAISYVPEIPWDNSCTNPINYGFLMKGSGPITFCNTKEGASLQNGVGGSSSQSVYYTKPDWQLTSVLGLPNDGVRDQPDVSLFAANGFWNHFYLECMSNTNEGGVPCNYSNPNDFFGSAYGGTSFGAPAFAGIAALIQQTYDSPKTIVPLGNPAPVFYKIAQAQFTTPLGLSGCNSTLGNKISSACVFQYITAGDNSEPCYAGTPKCVTSAASTNGIGVLKTGVSGKYVDAYPGQPGYSLATGLGTVNVTNLLYDYYIGL